jgi:tight adherence protein B
MNILVITLVIFLVVTLVVFGLYYSFVAARESTRSEVKRRLQSIAMRQGTEEVMPSILKEEVLSSIPALNRILFKVPLAVKADKLLDQADVRMKVSTLLMFDSILLFFGFLLGLLINRGILVAILFALILAALPYLYLIQKKNTRIRKFTEQFPDTLDMIARSLRAGHSFTSAMQVVSQEMPEPVSKVFRIAYDEQGLGLSLAESLNNMTMRINSIDLSFFVTAVNIQRDTGGNLAEILEKLGVTIRERFKILGQLKVYTAQGRLSGLILALIPVALALVLWIINPGYLRVLFITRTGLYMLGSAVVLQIIGFFVIRKIIRIQI